VFFKSYEVKKTVSQPYHRKYANIRAVHTEWFRYTYAKRVNIHGIQRAALTEDKIEEIAPL